jgi:acetolactate synthase-1/2/3 large subunit
MQITAGSEVALPQLAARVRDLLRQQASRSEAIRARTESLRELNAGLRQRWQEEAKRDWDAMPMTPARLASEIWQAVYQEDWVLTVNPLRGWATRLWDFDRPERFPGAVPSGLATASTISSSLGIGLAHRGSGKVVIDIQPDGDLMFDPSALWVASNQRLPLLIVMFNNRSYYNDWNHQILIARERGRSEENAWVGQTLTDPDPDFATIARGFGVHAEGPIQDPELLGPALARAVAIVKRGRPALVDAVARPR